MQNQHTPHKFQFHAIIVAINSSFVERNGAKIRYSSSSMQSGFSAKANRHMRGDMKMAVFPHVYGLDGGRQTMPSRIRDDLQRRSFRETSKLLNKPIRSMEWLMDYSVVNPRHFSAFHAAVSICSQYLGRLVNISVHFLAHLLPIHEKNDMPTRLVCSIFLCCCCLLLATFSVAQRTLHGCFRIARGHNACPIWMCKSMKCSQSLVINTFERRREIYFRNKKLPVSCFRSACAAESRQPSVIVSIFNERRFLIDFINYSAADDSARKRRRQ